MVLYTIYNVTFTTTVNEVNKWLKEHCNLEYYAQYIITEKDKEYKTFNEKDALKHVSCKDKNRIKIALSKGKDATIIYPYGDEKAYGTFQILVYDQKLITYNSYIKDIYGTTDLTSEQYFNELCNRQTGIGNASPRISMGNGTFKAAKAPDYDNKSFRFVYTHRR